MAVTPEQLAKSGTEHGHQAALMCWCAQSGIPESKWLFAIPNGFYATPAQKAKMKAEGLRSGVSDILLPVTKRHYIDDQKIITCGLFIEMKSVKGKISYEQAEFGRFVTSQGYQFVVCYSWIEARDEILRYLGK